MTQVVELTFYCVEFPGLKEARMYPRWGSHILWNIHDYFNVAAT